MGALTADGKVGNGDNDHMKLRKVIFPMSASR